jgi:5,10-methylene-tetrahydrofolate dehydrogenase/methenyl tetrahydrofolate cyclohydrolase
LELNENDEIDGFIVGCLQNKLMSKKVMAVDPSKDVDGFHRRTGKNGMNMTTFIPATPFRF